MMILYVVVRMLCIASSVAAASCPSAFWTKDTSRHIQSVFRHACEKFQLAELVLYVGVSVRKTNYE